MDSLKAKENALTKDFRPAFEALVHKYEIPDEHDAATNALSKIAEVKNVMHDNIKISMQNTVSLETVAHTTGLFGLPSALVVQYKHFELKRDLCFRKAGNPSRSVQAFNS